MKTSVIYYLYRHKNLLIVIFVLFWLIIIFLCSGCCATKYKEYSKIEIDTVYVNPVIDTITVLKEYQVRHDTLIFDTIRVENSFSKVKIFPVDGKIKAELLSKPFEIKIHAVKTEKTVITKAKNHFSAILLFLSFISGFIIGFIIHKKLWQA